MTLIERLEKLERSLKRIASPEARLERLLVVVWRELPRENNGFAKNIMQARSTTRGGDDYSPHLRELFQERVAVWLQECLPVTEAESHVIAGIVLMAFDGFAMNVQRDHGMAFTANAARLFSRMLAPPGSAQGEASGARGGPAPEALPPG